ncbi:unnamed protein product [Cunninghamella blakesleeana]
MTGSANLFRNVAGIMVRRKPGNYPAVSENNLHSVYRHPNIPLYLLVKKPRKHHSWQYPQGGLDSNETPLEGALRELAEECGEDIKVNPITSTPVCYYQYQFPEKFIAKHNSKYIGAKVDFLVADYISGKCIPDGNELVDYAWLSQSEIQHYVTPEYYFAIQPLFEV